MYSEYTVRERAVATVTDCVVASVRYVFGVYNLGKSSSNSNRLYRGVCTICIRSTQLVKEQKQQQQTVSWRLYDMYSEYTVSERAVATVTDCVVASIRYVYGLYS